MSPLTLSRWCTTCAFLSKCCIRCACLPASLVPTSFSIRRIELWDYREAPPYHKLLTAELYAPSECVTKWKDVVDDQRRHHRRLLGDAADGSRDVDSVCVKPFSRKCSRKREKKKKLPDSALVISLLLLIFFSPLVFFIHLVFFPKGKSFFLFSLPF